MQKNEFKDFCHDEFKRYGFKKQKSMYYRYSAEGLLCSLSLQGGCNYYYINCDFFIGQYGKPEQYPSQYEADIFGRPISVLSRDTFKGEHYMTALIEYEKYASEELKPFFTRAFEELILPPLQIGKNELLKHLLNDDDWDFTDLSIKSKEDRLNHWNLLNP